MDGRKDKRGREKEKANEGKKEKDRKVGRRIVNQPIPKK